MATLPLATLAVTIDENGITSPSFDDILQTMIIKMQQIFGSDIYLEDDSQEYQELAVYAENQWDTNQAFITLYQGMAPSFSQGAMFSALVKINGISRKSSSQSTATVTVTGVSGTQIVNGIVQDENGNQWSLPSLVTIPASGGIDVLATCLAQGSILAPANSIDIIATPTPGWQSVNNAADAITGAPVETDAELRIRQAQSTALPAQTPLDSIISAIANLPGVRRSAIYENDTTVEDGNGLPPHSIAIVADGGDPATIAQTIELKKSPGTTTFGSTSITVQDPAGLAIVINYFGLVAVPIFVTVTVRPMNGYVDSIADDITQELVDFINAIPIGDSVYLNWLISAAGLNGDLRFRVLGITLDTFSSPTDTADIFIAFNQAATTAAANIQVVTG
jgi:uncharacterized phage protein gp47/JayE